MSLKVTPYPQEGYLHAKVTGTYDLQDAIAKFQHMIELVRETGLSCVLVDFREMAGGPNPNQSFLYAIDVRAQYKRHLESGERPLKIAYLSPANTMRNHDSGLLVAYDFNLPFEMFSDFNDALTWLEIENPVEEVQA